MPHKDIPVGALWRALKTSAAEPLASKLGEKLGAYFLGHPAIAGALDGVSSDWRGLLATGIKAAGGVAELPGRGPIAYIANEALDAFVVGLGRSLEELKDKSPDEIANDLFAISAIDQAATRLAEVLDSEVVLTGRWFHKTGCPEARGRQKMTLREAAEHGYLPMNCRCLGAVFAVPTEEEQATATPKADPLTVIELIAELEREATDSDDATLLGQITHFRAEFPALSDALQLKFEFLAKEARPKEKLRLLIGYAPEEWEAVIDAMLPEIAEAVKSRGVVGTVVGGFSAFATQAVDVAKSGAENIQSTIDDMATAIDRNTAEVDRRYAEALHRQAFMKRFRASQAKKRGWFAYLALGSFAFFVTVVVYYAVTH